MQQLQALMASSQHPHLESLAFPSLPRSRGDACLASPQALMQTCTDQARASATVPGTHQLDSYSVGNQDHPASSTKHILGHLEMKWP